MADRLGQQFGNYRLVRLVGKGGAAEVYLGEHIHLSTLAAIKVLHMQLAGDEVEQFRAEARTLARLEHPHIVRILDFGIATIAHNTDSLNTKEAVGTLAYMAGDTT